MTLTGTTASVVERAIDSREALPGTAGFAGAIEGRLVRDVLGRYPLFFDPKNPAAWSHDPETLVRAERLPAGAVHEDGETRQVWTLSEPPAVSEEEGVEGLRDAIEATLADVDRSGLAVAFSGGVDSALLAAALDVELYTVGFPESHDIEAARSGAAALDADLTVLELDHETLEAAVPRVARAIGRTNAMDVQIALPLFLLADHCHEAGVDRLALGQGADELFGGYQKVARAPEDHRVEADTVRGARREVVRTLPGQLERDWLALQAGGVEPVTPFLHDRVVVSALELPEAALVAGETRKRALRQVATDWLPEEIAFRDKKALQYGSLVARELDRLARQAGFKRRMDDHVTQYIEHTLDETDETA
ncbi:asparagine synthase C-terminal domain-containing protein [Halovenus salina]|uniref:asparagine synthase C-terminal domain-containing protein n=1 Tax=Halovenus salina TaxID=1510225 RepID=UPI002260FE5C|nr:asparagine synthase-related protein [Halovenus salina]